jgi:hypothetical protein
MKPLQQQRSTQDLAALGHFVKDAVHDVTNDKSNNTASAKKRPAEDKDNKSKPNKSPHPKPKRQGWPSSHHMEEPVSVGTTLP